MTLTQWQEVVDKWIKQHGVRYFDPLTNMVILTEEVGELARYMCRLYGEQSFKSEKEEELAHESLKSELGDVFFVLTCIANQLNIDITEILNANISKKTDRDQDRHHSNPKLK